jgi:predicted transcriptional regulator
MNRRDRKKQQIIDQHYSGMKQADIARLLDVTPAYVSQIVSGLDGWDGRAVYGIPANIINYIVDEARGYKVSPNDMVVAILKDAYAERAQ